MARLPAYAVNGGSVPAEMLRRTLWATSNGANGVIGIGDLKVQQLPTPGPGVRVLRGAAIAHMQTWGTNSQESYMLAQDSFTNVNIPAGSSSYLIARIRDWHYTGEDAPDDPLNDLYWDFQRVSTLDGITYPHVPLARIQLPSGVSTVLDAHITDIREVANPRNRRRLFARNLTASDGISEIYEQVDQYWPVESAQDWEVDIPEWATRANIVAAWNGVSVVPDSNKHGVVWARIGRPAGWGQGNVETQHQRWDLGGSATGREHWEVADSVEIPAALRGTRQRLRLLGKRLETLSGQAPKLDRSSSIKFDIEFIETAARDLGSGEVHGG